MLGTQSPGIVFVIIIAVVFLFAVFWRTRKYSRIFLILRVKFFQSVFENLKSWFTHSTYSPSTPNEIHTMTNTSFQREPLDSLRFISMTPTLDFVLPFFIRWLKAVNHLETLRRSLWQQFSSGSSDQGLINGSFFFAQLIIIIDDFWWNIYKWKAFYQIRPDTK